MAQAIIAVRGGPDAKSRCADVLSAAGRDELTAAMLTDMLAAVSACGEVSATWVVTPTPRLDEILVGHAGPRQSRQMMPRSASGRLLSRA